MQLIQLFLPLYSNDGRRFSRELFEQVERELVEQFEGFTAYPRSPASGLWISPSEDLRKDDMIIYEVLVQTLDRSWWGSFRSRLETLFQQDAIHVRSLPTELL
jgi:hypothetical protein